MAGPPERAADGPIAGGFATICTIVLALVDTSILVYRFDPRFSEKQATATRLLRSGIVENRIRLAHQAIVEFVSVVSRPIDGGQPLLGLSDARREAEEFFTQFEVLYPTAQVARTALRAAAAYDLNWFDAHMWAYAEVFGIDELITENMEPGRLYGSVRIVNPFT